MKKSLKLSFFILTAMLALSLAGCAGKSAAASAPSAQSDASVADTSGQLANSSETVTPEKVVEDWMTPIEGSALQEGSYPVTVASSSSMFKIVDCTLTVKDGKMTAAMTMGGTGYLKLYMGTGAEAATAQENDCIPFVENSDGTHTFTVPVEALDMGIDCAAFSKNKGKWYDRTLVFRADSLPAEALAEGTVTTVEALGLEDGLYTVEVLLEGGSGRAGVTSPAPLRIQNGQAFATIIWGSNNYDYMKVGDQRYDPVSMEEFSTFEIPVSGFDRALAVIADTTAMSTPHEVSYTLTFASTSIQKAAA